MIAKLIDTKMWRCGVIFVLFFCGVVVGVNKEEVHGLVESKSGNNENPGLHSTTQREEITKKEYQSNLDSFNNEPIKNQGLVKTDYEESISKEKVNPTEDTKLFYNENLKLMNESKGINDSITMGIKEDHEITGIGEQIQNSNINREAITQPQDTSNKHFEESSTLESLSKPNNENLAQNSQSEKEDKKTTNTSDDNNNSEDSRKPISISKEEEEKDVCFPRLGCFSMGKPWKSLLRPIGAPYPPEKIGTTLFFYSRANLDKQVNITLYPQIDMGKALFDPKKLTAIIVHGFANSGNATWMKDMKNAYLKQVDANVIIVDWGKGAQLLNYLQVAGNTRVVGKQLGMFVDFLKEQYGADPGKFHLIGHSLGAQICSYLAKHVPGIARLTALDPAQPGFEGFNKEVRLDSSDAEFVDVVHTDARPFIPTLGFGMITPHGHVDFYINGGFDQPGCLPPPKKDLPSINNILDLAKYPVEVIAKIVACPHGRAYEYLTESFNETEKCIFWGHKAGVSNVFKTVTNTVTHGVLKKYVALSTSCSKENCIPLGFSTKKSTLRGIFVVTTGGRAPYCISEPGIPPETSQPNDKRESFIQKIAKKVPIG